MRYVLVMPGWFPTKVDSLTGDFIERHARAAARFIPVKILYVQKNNALKPFSFQKENRSYPENCTASIVYYCATGKNGFFEKIVSFFMQKMAYAKAFSSIKKQFGLPGLLHVHVITTKSFFALKLYNKYNIPIIVSEQWTGYLNEAVHEFYGISAFQKRIMKKLFASASMVTTVSDYLAKNISEYFSFKQYRVIPNLVDTEIFFPENHKKHTCRFIHVSTLSYQKNFDDILQAASLLRRKNKQFELLVVGPEKENYKAFVDQNKLQENVIFKPETSQKEIAALMRSSDALILFSRYETFGCVIVEANACGIPVIVSSHPVFNENVINGVTGIMVTSENPQELAEAMFDICMDQTKFNGESIAALTEKNYGMETIGKKFYETYQIAMNPPV